MKKGLILFLGAICLVVGSASSDDETVAVVGKKAILKSEVVSRMREEKTDFQTALARTITQKLLLVEAENQKLEVPRERVLQEVMSIRKAVGGEESFRRKLEESGLSYDAFVRRVEQDLKVSLFLSERIGKKISVTTADLIRASAKWGTQELYHLKGKDFSSREAAEEYYRSWNPEKVSDLEEIGWVRKEQLKPHVYEVVSRTEVGRLTPPVVPETRWHVFLVTEQKKDEIPAEAKIQFREEIYRQKYAVEFSNLIQELQKKIPVRVLIPENQFKP
ncbi:MAG: SurA N-terminal domain-containing protein [Candidatus Omnitrophica bacterium]|nr:SurA N-terminal domain-containing protein [Candidatus Omnitrophota bacterium]